MQVNSNNTVGPNTTQNIPSQQYVTSSSMKSEEIIENASKPTYSPDGKSFAYVKNLD